MPFFISYQLTGQAVNKQKSMSICIMSQKIRVEATGI